MAKVWLMNVGRVPLYLLDCDVDGNSPQDRELTSRLYGGDMRTRIRQELVLGVGGVKALRALGIMPGVYHLNEGHSAFAPLEVIRQRMADDGLTFDEALREVAHRTVFTTHTPVPAGHDRFDAGLVEEHLGPAARQARHLAGPADGPRPRRAAKRARAVLHDGDRPEALAAGQRRQLAARPRLAADVGPPLAVARRRRNPHRPHHQRRPHSQLARLPDAPALRPRTCGADWQEWMGDPKVWQNAVQRRSGRAVGNAQRDLKNRLLDFVRRRVGRQMPPPQRSRMTPSKPPATMLDPNALTIGFARRFATYKRADLFFRQLDELAELINDPQRPVQLIFAGKAHPADEPGKQLIKKIANLRHDPPLRRPHRVHRRLRHQRRPPPGARRRRLAQHAAPPEGSLRHQRHEGRAQRRPQPARFSTAGGPRPTTARTASPSATARQHVDDEITDARDARHSASTSLRDEVIPLFYDRDADGLPRQWIEMMVESIATLAARFSAHRMVHGLRPQVLPGRRRRPQLGNDQAIVSSHKAATAGRGNSTVAAKFSASMRE